MGSIPIARSTTSPQFPHGQPQPTVLRLLLTSRFDAVKHLYSSFDIDPSSAYISGGKGTKTNPVFYVTCGKNAGAFNVFFSKSDVEADNRFTAAEHIQKTRAADLCEAYAKANAAHPSTVDFSRFMNLAISEHPNGRTAVTSSFTAKNSFNLELKFNIKCLLDRSGLLEANIAEAQ